MRNKKYPFYTIAFAMLVSSLFVACGNNNDAGQNTVQVPSDSQSTDSAIQNEVLMPADNTLAKDSASNREDLGGGSQ